MIKIDEIGAKRITFCVSLIVILYVFAWYNYYGTTALGISPALDNQQTLLLAQQMAEGTLPQEPFHRAPLYPFLLSFFFHAGLTLDALPVIARALNAVALLTCVAASIHCSLRIWKSTTAAWISGLLVGLNPVILFFAADPFDILLATACLCLSLNPILNWIKDRDPKSALIAATILALGASLRSHLLPLLIIWNVACLAMPSSKRTLNLICASAPLCLSLLLLGVINHKLSGEFRCLPWQGAYNLWAGNNPDASGKIYTQSISVEFVGAYDNPAKLESIALFEQETNKTPPHSIQQMNRHWIDRTTDHIKNHPVEWLTLMFRKAYFFLNNYEQYDNKTYNFHKELHPLLRWNPIHWGLLLLLAVGGTLIGLREPSRKAILITLIVLFAIYAAGTILFYTPNRFRVPMIPVLCILAGGITGIREAWIQAFKGWKIFTVSSFALTFSIAYSNLQGVSDNKTWAEDYALLSNASLRTQRDMDAIRWAQKALEMNSNRDDMRHNQTQAKFNLWAFSGTKISPTYSELSNLLEEARRSATSNQNIQIITGIYEWKLNNEDSARATWIEHRYTNPFAELCLFWTSSNELPQGETSDEFKRNPNYTLLRAATAEKNEPTDLTITFNFIFQQISQSPH
ncbi:MAG: hypothetical protein ACSHYA_05990 [Opitutaceae bacterium]